MRKLYAVYRNEKSYRVSKFLSFEHLLEKWIKIVRFFIVRK